jgi:hypothetical protein
MWPDVDAELSRAKEILVTRGVFVMRGNRRTPSAVGALIAAALGLAVLTGCEGGTQQPAAPVLSTAVPTTTTSTSTTTTVATTTTTTAATSTTTTAPVATAAPAPAPQPVQNTPAQPAPVHAPAPAPAACGSDSYVNVDGNCVHRPQQAPAAPAGATARCHDGTYSFSQHRSGTCSGHGGVAAWL